MENQEQVWELFNSDNPQYKALFTRPKNLGLQLLPTYTYADWFKLYGVTDSSIELCIEIARKKIFKHIDTVCDLLKINVGYSSYTIPADFFKNTGEIKSHFAMCIPTEHYIKAIDNRTLNDAVSDTTDAKL